MAVNTTRVALKGSQNASADPSWRTRMATASFRGFDFLTDSHDAKGGRRLVVHEYPGADEPLTEDLGAKAGGWRLNAYFIGPDYDLERNGLLAKLAEPGADWLTHPWLGYLWVRAHDWSVHDSNDKGGMGTVAIDFVPGGEQPFTSEPDRVDVAIDRVRKFADLVVDDYAPKPMSADGMTAFIAAVQKKLDVLRNVVAMATLPLTWASQVMGLVASVKGELGALMALPAGYAAALRGLTDILGGGADDSSLADTERPRVIAQLLSGMNTGAIKLTGVAATDAVVRGNLLAEDALRKRLLVSAAAQVAITTYQAEADRDAVLAAVVSAIDGLLPGMSDPVFQAALSARAAVTDALLAQDLKPAVIREVARSLPSVVLAHRLGIDESVLLARNGVRHPLFVKGLING